MLNVHILHWVPLHFNFAIPCERNILHFVPILQLRKVTAKDMSEAVHVRCSVCVCSVAQSCSTHLTTWTVAHQALLSMGLYRKEYWSGLPFPSPRDLPIPGIKPESPVSPALLDRFFITEPPGKPVRSHPACQSSSRKLWWHFTIY